MPSSNDYRATLVHFMNFKDGRTEPNLYTKETVFTQEELLAVTPEDVTRWFKHKAYGTADPSPTDLPNKCRSTSLEYWKKALSSFMPNRLMSWNVATAVGNPVYTVAP